MLIATTNDVPGYEIQEVLGEVFGLTVRSRNIGSQIGASFKSLVGGELDGMTKTLAESREQVIERLVAEAEAKGGNAILAMRFDTSELGSDLDRDLRLRDRRADQEGLGPLGVRAPVRSPRQVARVVRAAALGARAPARGRRRDRRPTRSRPTAARGPRGDGERAGRGRRVRHPVRVLDQALDAAEALGERPDLRPRDEVDRLLLRLDEERDHPAEVAHLPRGDLVPRMFGQPGIQHLADGRAPAGTRRPRARSRSAGASGRASVFSPRSTSQESNGPGTAPSDFCRKRRRSASSSGRSCRRSRR